MGKIHRAPGSADKNLKTFYIFFVIKYSGIGVTTYLWEREYTALCTVFKRFCSSKFAVFLWLSQDLVVFISRCADKWSVQLQSWIARRIFYRFSIFQKQKWLHFRWNVHFWGLFRSETRCAGAQVFFVFFSHPATRAEINLWMRWELPNAYWEYRLWFFAWERIFLDVWMISSSTPH